jgi:hypothetical protein
MDPHPIPRQITTFEFKLIGFLTLKQFIYLVIFSPLGIIVYYLFPLPLLNILLAIIPVILGIALAFVPYNERPLDIWIRNFLKKLLSSSQYYYVKKNQPPAFLKDFFIYSSPQIINTHVEANQKLTSYLSKTNPPKTDGARKQEIHQLIRSGTSSVSQPTTKTTSPPQSPPTTPSTLHKTPFIFGVVKNNKNIPIPNALIYIKNSTGQNRRILKTNTHGIFAGFHPLSSGDYVFEIKDLGGKYFFDTMKVAVPVPGGGPLNFVSKETL